MPNYTYSFLDVQCAVTGPGGSFSISEGGIENGGITIAMAEDKGALVTGADGTPMHSLHASKAGKITIRVLKVSPLNRLLQTMYNYDTTSAANYGQNTIVVRDSVRGDSHTARFCGFAKKPDAVYDKEGAMNEWTFNAGYVDSFLGSGSPATGV